MKDSKDFTEKRLLEYEKEYETVSKSLVDYEEKIKSLKDTTGIDFYDIIQTKTNMEDAKAELGGIIETFKKGLELQSRCKELKDETDYINKLTKIGWLEKSEFLLNKMITCSLCGNKFTAYVTKSKNRYYRCQGYKKKTCVAKSVRADLIERMIKEAYFTALKHTGIDLYEIFDTWIFNRMVEDTFINLKNLPCSLEAINLLKKEFKLKIIELEEYINLPISKKQDFAKSTYWLIHELNYLKMIKYDVLKKEGEIVFNVRNEEKKISFVV